VTDGLDRHLVLGDGRRLAYAEWGEPDAFPVFFFHGTPNSRLLHLGADLPRRAGVRLVYVDRPGFGQSDQQPGRTLLDWPRDVEALADHLGVDEFGVAGQSGGGAYAFACAFALPQRVVRAAIVSGVGPYADVDALGDAAASGDLVRLRSLARTDAAAAEQLALEIAGEELREIQLDPTGDFLERWNRDAPPADRELVDDPVVRAVHVESLRETARRGPKGYARELLIFWTLPWGFTAADVRVPVTVWHGDRDPWVDIAVAEHFAAQGCELRLVPGGGHLVLFTEAEAVLRGLVG